MKTTPRTHCIHQALLLVALGGLCGLLPTGGFAQDPAAAADNQAVEVQTRGPVHEAFAETIALDPQPGIIVQKAPPDPIEELPPDVRPDGENVEWIPGYWAWDDDRTDFLWVSGIWRALPPDRSWVPGYWTQINDTSYQWISGYWNDATHTDVQYLSEAPPPTLEAGPNVDAPGDSYTWAPGTWVWQTNRYAWQPGYWIAAQPNWMWVPAHYVYAPGGYVFVNGYFDYPVDNRGVLFAPVYFNQPVYTNAGYYYSPAVAVSLGVFSNYLFQRPGYQHYYFGDYYAPGYARNGFSPWFASHNRGGYDPIYSYQRWRHRDDRDWEHGLARDFEQRRDNENARPAHTWNDQQRRGSGDGRDANSLVGTRIDDFAKRNDSNLRFHPIDKQERQKLAGRQKDFERFRNERQQIEKQKPGGPDQNAAGRVKLPQTPIASRTAEQLGVRDVPQRPKLPNVDSNAQAKPRAGSDRPGRARIGSDQLGNDRVGSDRIGGAPTNQPGQPGKIQDLNSGRRRGRGPDVTTGRTPGNTGIVPPGQPVTGNQPAQGPGGLTPNQPNNREITKPPTNRFAPNAPGATPPNSVDPLRRRNSLQQGSPNARTFPQQPGRTFSPNPLQPKANLGQQPNVTPGQTYQGPTSPNNFSRNRANELRGLGNQRVTQENQRNQVNRFAPPAATPGGPTVAPNNPPGNVAGQPRFGGNRQPFVNPNAGAPGQFRQPAPGLQTGAPGVTTAPRLDATQQFRARPIQPAQPPIGGVNQTPPQIQRQPNIPQPNVQQNIQGPRQRTFAPPQVNPQGPPAARPQQVQPPAVNRPPVPPPGINRGPANDKNRNRRPDQPEPGKPG
ncbi:MAG TPA: hypothetical protein VL175_01450 [Pirellulales bacterium]|nr:hypothetical protein [Pirellulales bacterium]